MFNFHFLSLVLHLMNKTLKKLLQYFTTKTPAKFPIGNEKEIIYQDKFNNMVTVTKMKDGNFKKEIQTNKNSVFEFLGYQYSYDLLNSAETVKVYWDENHSERSLVKDKYGRLFHYRYDEEMNFDDGDDREDILWTMVGNEADSDELSQKGGLSLLREPYIASAETNWVAAHEILEKKT